MGLLLEAGVVIPQIQLSKTVRVSTGFGQADDIVVFERKGHGLESTPPRLT